MRGNGAASFKPPTTGVVPATTHAVQSMSGAPGWMSCIDWEHSPGSNKYADWGTAAHELGAWTLLNHQPPAEYPYDAIMVNGTWYDVDERMIEYIEMYRQEVLSYPGALEVEVSMSIEHITGEVGAKGTADAVIIKNVPGGIHVTIVDLKTGQRRVRATSPQLLGYAAAAAHRYDILGDVVGVDAVIVQPPLDAIDVASYTKLDLDAFVVRARQAAHNHRNKIGVRTPSEAGCQWCAKKAECPALARFVEEQMGSAFDNLDETVKEVPVDEDLSLKYKALPLVEMWVEAVRETVRREVADGNESLGYKFIQGRKGARRWADKEQVRAFIEKLLRSSKRPFKREVAYKVDLQTPTKIVALLEKGGHTKYLEKLAPMIEQSDGALQLVPMSDPRPAVRGVNVFDDLTEKEIV